VDDGEASGLKGEKGKREQKRGREDLESLKERGIPSLPPSCMQFSVLTYPSSAHIQRYVDTSLRSKIL
jgi:hypothetical protein